MDEMIIPKSLDSDFVKACCTAVYESEYTKLLLGNSFHPGGMALTERLGALLELKPTDHVLDVATGQGSSTTLFHPGSRAALRLGVAHHII